MKLLFIFGTRPEAIKLAPVIRQASHWNGIETSVCVTGQHRNMLEQVLKVFDITPDYDLNVLSEDQSLNRMTAKILERLEGVIHQEKPTYVVLQGDTTSAMAASLASFYAKVQIAHVEAGLRTWNKWCPFPEEINRVIISHMADVHFCPTEWSRLNLVKEGVDSSKTYVTGNTVVDALHLGLRLIEKEREKYEAEFRYLNVSKKLLLVTGHRRESFGAGFRNICEALKEISVQLKGEIEILYPVHLNPNVRGMVHSMLRNLDNVYLVEPLEYLSFVYVMGRSHMILSDSGGVQEEAPSLGKPVLVMREVSERPEGIEGGNTKLVGTDKRRLVDETITLLKDRDAYKRMSEIRNPYGDGKASGRILDTLHKLQLAYGNEGQRSQGNQGTSQVIGSLAIKD